MKGLFAGIRFAIGVGIGIIVAKEVRDAYKRYTYRRRIKTFWSEVKKAWNEVSENPVE